MRCGYLSWYSLCPVEVYECDALFVFLFFFFFKQKTAYEMRISDWSSDVCSSDLDGRALMAAIAVGYEVAIRIARNMHPASRHRGFHNSSVAGQIGRASCRERVCQYV